MKENVLSLILQIESDYHKAVDDAVEKADVYVTACRQDQRVFFSELDREWELFEAAEQKKFDIKLKEEEHRMEKELASRKIQLKARQQDFAELISERLKKEVLSLDGSR
ncbi:MAG: hypothetical protein FWH55_07980 [Oscillospiraceae bacterium]|nr:hypothetical protein [Oscillospiraceae bacterium]